MWNRNVLQTPVVVKKSQVSYVETQALRALYLVIAKSYQVKFTFESSCVTNACGRTDVLCTSCVHYVITVLSF